MNNTPKPTRLPLDELMVAANATTINELGRQIGMTRHALQAMKGRGGFTIHYADVVAARLGMHPTEVWGEAFYGPLLVSA